MSIPTLDAAQFHEILEQWRTSNERSDNQELIELINRIFTECYKWGDSMKEMCLFPITRDNVITIQTLPKELFCYPPFNKYSEIDLSNWGVHEIPDTLFLNKELKFLNLSDNPLTVLCKDIQNLKQLEDLKICNTYLSTLPEEIGELGSLESLELCSNRLHEVPKSLGNLKNLKVLNISNNRGDISQENDLPKGLIPCLHKLENVEVLGIYRNRLERLPEDLTEALQHMKNLATLDLSNNSLSRLPENLEFLKNLKQLYSLLLCNNSLSELPSEFFTSLKDLKGLYIINLSDNRLQTIPDNFIELRPGIRLILNGNRFSRQEVERILQITRQPGYNGPVIDLSIQDYTGELEKDSNEIIKELFKIAKVPRKSFQLEDSLELNSWLNRISEIPEFNSATNKQLVAEKILAVLEQASINTSFKHVFYETIARASETCGDRVALSLLYLDVHHGLESIDITNMENLANFLKNGIWTLDLLEKCAREKVSKLAGIDEIETYLAYPILLRETLHIPIIQQGMLYFKCSGITKEDLEEAKNFVVTHHNDKEKFIHFLVTQEKWIEAIKRNYPMEMQEIEARREGAANQENIDTEACLAIQEEYIRKISALSEKALSQKNTV